MNGYNATKAVVIKIDGSEQTIIGQADFTNSYSGELIEGGSKSDGDWVVNIDSELSGKGFELSGQMVYNSDTSFRAMLDDSAVGTIGSYKMDYGDGINNLYMSAIPHARSDDLNRGTSANTNVTFSSTGDVYGPQLPSLSLDFANGRYYSLGSANIDDLLTTKSRNSVATYYDSGNNLRTAAVDELRISTDPESGYTGFLSEGESTNLLLWSNDFTNAAWDKEDTTVGADGTKGPDPTEDMVLITDTSSTGGYVQQSIGIPAGSEFYACSFYLRRGNQPVAGFRLAMTGGTAVFSAGTYNFDTKVLSNNRPSDVEMSVEEIRSGIVRMHLTAQNNSTNTTLNLRIAPSDFDSSNIGDTTYATYAQVEQLEFCSSPIKTESTELTRVRDNFSINIGDWFNETNGTLFVDFLNKDSNGKERYFASLTDSTAIDRFSIYSQSETVITGRNVENNVSTTVDIGSVSVGESGKAAVGYNATEIKGSASGENVTSTSVTSPSSKTVLNLGGRDGGSGGAFTVISKISYIPIYLADDEMEAISL